MDNDQATSGGPFERLEGKIDALTSVVGAMDTRLGGVEKDVGEVKDRLSTVEAGLSRIETQLSGVQKELTNVHVLAGETKKFSENVADSVTSLTRNMEEGFKDARKERERGFDLVHKAIRDWGGRVHDLETARARTTKRRP